MPQFFITATGTDIGKTFITTALCWQLRQNGQKVMALKPVMSGYDPSDDSNDASLILKSCGISPSSEAIAAISPWSFTAPLAPPMSAALEGKNIDFKQLITFCHDSATSSSATLLVEGAGGVMSPLTENHTMLDWMEALNWPVILVTGTYLGAISHLLSAIECLKAKTLSIHTIIICESESSPTSLTDIAAIMKKFVPASIPIVLIPRLKANPDLWKQVPSLYPMCNV